MFAFPVNLFLLYKKDLHSGENRAKILAFQTREVSIMQDKLSLREIDAYAEDAIDDLDVSILDVIKGMQIGDFNSDFAVQILQYLRVKILSCDGGNDLEGDARSVLARIIKILND